MRKLLCLVVMWMVGHTTACAGASRIHDNDGTPTQTERYSNGETPKPPEPLPARFGDYQVLPGGLSPDTRYALIYPRRSRIYDLADHGLFLVAFQPFRVLCELPLGSSNLCPNARCGYVCQWAADSSVVVMVAGSRWGAERVSAVSLRAGHVVHRAELTRQVRRLVREDYARSGAGRYNDHIDFVFTDDYFVDGRYTAIPLQEGWKPDLGGCVRINCVCTNNPKTPDQGDWKVHFTGTWDLHRGTFVEQHFVRVPASHPSD